MENEKKVVQNKATKKILELFEKTGFAIAPFEKAVGLSEGTIKNLKNGRNNASADTICKFAEFFNISTDYIMGYVDSPKSPTSWYIFKRIIYKLNKSIDDIANNIKKPLSFFVDWEYGKEPTQQELWAICNSLQLKINPFEPVITSANIIKRPEYTLSDKLTEDYENLLKDKRVINSALLINEMEDRYREQIYSYIVGIATGLGLNIAQIIKK